MGRRAPSERGVARAPGGQTIDLRANDAFEERIRGARKFERPEDEARSRKHDFHPASRKKRPQSRRYWLGEPVDLEAQWRFVERLGRCFAPHGRQE